MANEIFISYSRRDNLTLKEKVPGLVSALHAALVRVFEREGDDGITIWRDVFEIEQTEQYRPKLEEAIDQAEIMIVVHSGNWEKSKWCREEINRFTKKYLKDGAKKEDIRERIFALWVQDVDRNEVSEWLQGQEGYRLHEKGSGGPLYDANLGEANSDQWYTVAGTIGKDLLSKAKKTFGLPRKTAGAVARRQINQPHQTALDAPTVYVAIPASDMRSPYGRVVDELTRRGYRVVPDPEKEVPTTETELVSIVQSSLEEAAFSVHLLGETRGFRPERKDAKPDEENGEALPLTHLQLERARALVPRKDGTELGDFRRVIWAPRTMPDAMEHAEPRDPFEILRYHLEISPHENGADHIRGDKVVGDTQTEFVQMLIDFADNMPRDFTVEPLKLQKGARLYLNRDVVDRDAALEIAMHLNKHDVAVMLPALKGTAEQLLHDHRRCLKLCSEYLLCWKSTSDTWVRSQMFELLDWRDFGRDEPFRFRAVLTLPPNDIDKEDFIKLPPAGVVDQIIDISTTEVVTDEVLRPLFKFMGGGRE